MCPQKINTNYISINMTEEFLCYLWEFHRFTGDLHLTDGRNFRIISSGIRNRESGPDFFDARIQIDDFQWIGNVEIHLKASDWERHHHQMDKSYDNVILHVVFDNDKTIETTMGEPIPTFSAEKFLDIKLWEQFQQIVKGRGWIPCAGLVGKTDDFVVMSWLENIAAERLIKRQEEIETVLQRTGNDWDAAYWIRLCRNFGFKVNAEPFEMLGRMLPPNLLLKHADNLLAVEAMLFGVAGMLDEDFEDDYPKQLKKEFEFYRKKFNINSIENHLWKFMRTHPANFPTIRLAELVQVVRCGGSRLSNILEAANVEELKKLFSVSASEYWNNHFRFDKISSEKSKILGNDAIDLLLINTIIPFIFSYGQLRGDDAYCEKALILFQQIPPENNQIIRNWEKVGIKAQNAMESQALIQLKQQYCTPAKCLQCRIGDYLLRLGNV